MRTILVFILLSLFLINCDSGQKDYSNLDSITFYDYEGNEIEMLQLKKEWNSTINSGEFHETLYDPTIENIQIRTIEDNNTYENYLVLVASTTNKKTHSGKIITSYLDGFKLSDRTVTCTDCGTNFQGELVDGKWICANNGESIKGCTRTSSLDY